jgi:hypothetical protein
LSSFLYFDAIYIKALFKMNKEFIRMQKLAGLMTEGLYTSDEKAPMEGVSTGKMTMKELKAKIKEMMAPMPEDDDTRIDYSMGKTGPNQMPRPPKSLNIDIDEDTAGEMAYAEMGSLDEDHTMDAYQIARELVRKMPFPDAVFASKDLFLATIDALHDELYSYAEDQFGDAGSAPDEDDNYDDSRDVYDNEYPDMAEGDLFEAKEDEESDTEDVIVAEPGDGEVPAEDIAVDATADDTRVDLNMDGVPDVDTGSPESKKAFTSAVDAYNDAKALGDPKYTQILANALTYYNKNIILKAGRPQA